MGEPDNPARYTEFMPEKDPFSLDTSGRLTVDLDRAYPGRAVDFDHVRKVLKKHFRVAWGKNAEDPLGDSCFWDFTWEGEAFTLHWDHWTGLELTALQPSGHGRLRQIAAYFDANPPPFLPPPRQL